MISKEKSLYNRLTQYAIMATVLNFKNEQRLEHGTDPTHKHIPLNKESVGILSEVWKLFGWENK